MQEELEEGFFEEMNGIKKKPIAAILNKDRLSKYELDDVFAT